MIDIAPIAYIIKEAYHDEMCLKGSTIADADYILVKSRTAVEKLSPSATIYLDQPLAQSKETNPGGAANAPAGGPPDSSTLEMEARDVLHTVKQTINEFRDALWDSLARVRNHLMGTTLMTGLLTYVLLCIAILAGALPAAIKTATILYLLGAMIGLFSRLYSESRTN